MQEALVDMGSALHGLSLEQVSALYQLFNMKAFGEPATVNICNKHLHAFEADGIISLAVIGTDIQQAKVFADNVRAQHVRGLMGAATDAPRQAASGTSPALANTAPRVHYPPGSLAPCRMCAAKGIDFRCKSSEWREHARIAHPRDSRSAKMGRVGGRGGGGGCAGDAPADPSHHWPDARGAAGAHRHTRHLRGDLRAERHYLSDRRGRNRHDRV